MAKVLGFGGMFFKSPDPAALMAWYQRHLGLDNGGYAVLAPSAMPPGGATVFAAFKADSDKFAPTTREFMFNLVVDDLEGALKQVQEGGATLVDEVVSDEIGSFGWFMDPDGNKVELWQPKGDAPAA
ncbi:VOC family protein [Pseudoduganella sp. GCM10020061]|uniref:VOC family protein n=1 Tax=Pseudoduganella sp. GCM10020061 TaxID=3317345 RepID=UPI003641A14B